MTTIDVDGPVGAGVGVQLGGFEDSIYGVTGYSSDVQFEVQDDANAIAQALVANGNGALNNAEDVNVDGGVVSVDSAADIQGVAEYNASVSDYAIEDSSAAILQGAATVIDSGVEQVFVTDTVSVVDGVSLSDMEVALEAERGLDTADIDFDVVGSASEIIANAAELSGASIVTVTNASVDASDGVALNTLEVSLLGDDSQANVDFHVEDSAAAIASVLAASGAS